MIKQDIVVQRHRTNLHLQGEDAASVGHGVVGIGLVTVLDSVLVLLLSLLSLGSGGAGGLEEVSLDDVAFGGGVRHWTVSLKKGRRDSGLARCETERKQDMIQNGLGWLIGLETSMFSMID